MGEMPLSEPRGQSKIPLPCADIHIAMKQPWFSCIKLLWFGNYFNHLENRTPFNKDTFCFSNHRLTCIPSF